jgi:peptidoglycan/LPS O-acetylase OafA/YrhL
MSASRPTAKLNNVQLLRAYAAVAVVYFHTRFHFGHVYPIGSFGVDLFFVISGYIMARILDSERTRQYFLRRRLLRIVPPYWFFTLLVFVASIFVPQMMISTRNNIPELLKSLVFIPFMKGSGVIRPTLFIGWSINYEMFFYVALAIGLAIAPRRAVWIGSGIILAILAACSFVPHPGPVVQFYSDPIIIEFVMGVLGYYVCQSMGPIRSTSLKSLLLVVGITAALALSFFQAFHLYFTHIRAISLGIAAWIAVCAAVLLASNGWDTRNKLLILIGDASYILYLVHTFVIYFLDRALAHRLGHWLSDSTVSGMAIGVTASVVLSILLHLYAERPVLRILTSRYGGHRPPSEFQPTP